MLYYSVILVSLIIYRICQIIKGSMVVKQRVYYVSTPPTVIRAAPIIPKTIRLNFFPLIPFSPSKKNIYFSAFINLPYLDIKKSYILWNIALILLHPLSPYLSVNFTHNFSTVYCLAKSINVHITYINITHKREYNTK